jgi:FkbM family methyltransferase
MYSPFDCLWAVTQGTDRAGGEHMDLHFNIESSFTKWVVSAGLLREPFVVVDVGVQGGENPRWHLLGDYLIVHGFDAIEEVVHTLQRQNSGNSKRVYHWIAAGSEDEDRTFYYNANDPCSSSFYPHGADRFGLMDGRAEQPRQVHVRRLDTLLADGTIPTADFLKIDVEGFEKEVLLGAPALLRSVLGVETETNFGVSPTYPKGHFCTLHELLTVAHLLVFDLNFDRMPRYNFTQALSRMKTLPIADLQEIGKPATLNVLFCRDLIDNTDHPENYTTPGEPANIDQIIKTMIIYELYGLSDVALDTVVRFSDLFGERLDVEKAIALLADPLCRAPGHRGAEFSARAEKLSRKLQAAIDRLHVLENSISWRITAPLRAARRALIRD